MEVFKYKIQSKGSAVEKMQTALMSKKQIKCSSILRVFNLSMQVIGSYEDALQWFKSPQFAFNNRLPIDLVDTEMGCNEIEDLLNQIKYGVVS